MRRRRWLFPLLLLVAVGAVCGAMLGRSGVSWGGLGETQSGVPNVDFHMMAIATRPTKATAFGTTFTVQVKAWERCALGLTTCNSPRRSVEAICLGNGRTVVIDEADWPAFQRIPGEDLKGVTGLPQDMNLCAAPRP
jgi:hypothetical protein